MATSTESSRGHASAEQGSNLTSGSVDVSLQKKESLLLSWLWRIWSMIAGTLLCMNFFTSVVVVGWLMRWTRIRILRRWWKLSERSQSESFSEFLHKTGHEHLVLRPHWLLAENGNDFLKRPNSKGETPGPFTKLRRYISFPIHSLFKNLKIGALTVLCVWLVTGWGSVVTYFSWQYGWNNSFHKGYEQAFFGPITGFLGSLLLVLGLMYVPLARAHCASTGRFRDFFDVSMIWRLIQTRFTAYVGLAFWIVLLALPIEVLKTAPAFFDGQIPFWTNATDKELLTYLQQYYLGCSVALFFSIWMIANLSARLYAGSMVKALRVGKVKPEELPAHLREWLGELNLLDSKAPRRGSIFSLALKPGSWAWRWSMWALLMFIWFGFIAKVYVGEFLHRHKQTGFLNHPVMQLPCMNRTPPELAAKVKRLENQNQNKKID